MRQITDVIDQMLIEIPESEGGLRSDLGKLKTSAMYTAPEGMGRRWYQGAHILSLYLNPANLNEWQKKVTHIWMNTQPTPGVREELG